jgi:hypothetical protein
MVVGWIAFISSGKLGKRAGGQFRRKTARGFGNP